MPQGSSKQLEHGGRGQMQNGGDGGTEMMNLELMKNYGILLLKWCVSPGDTKPVPASI